jgi:amino acid adenylation domain-containing protein
LMPPRDSVESGLIDIWKEVLEVDRISVHDNFFELGGHSLLATQLFARVWNTFEVELPLRSIFEQPTIAELATRISQVSEEGQKLQRFPIVSVPQEGESPLSFSQERMWFLYHLESGGPAYSIPFAIHVSGVLNIRIFEQCINEILKRHDVLRTEFQTVGGQPVQVVHPVLHLTLQAIDLQSFPQGQRNDECRRLARIEAQIPFELGQAPLLRGTVYRLATAEHVLFLNMHHIVSDAWSMDIFFQELMTVYRALQEDRPSPLLQLPIQYGDFALWQRHEANEKIWEDQRNYWKKQLAGCPLFLDFPTDHSRPSVQGFEGGRVSFTIPHELTMNLKEVSHQERVTVFMTLLAAFNILLFRYSGQNEFLVGVPSAGRNREEVAGMIGLFANTLALRADLSRSPSFTELVTQVRRVALEAFANQDLPFEQVVTALHPERTLSHSPLFQVMFSYEKLSQGGRAFFEEIPGLSCTPMDLEQQTAKFDLTLFMEETNSGLTGAIEYRTDLFDEETIHRLIGHFKVLLQGIVTDPSQSVDIFPLLTDKERQQVLVEWNATDHPFPNRCLHVLIEDQVFRTPHEIAVTDDEGHLTYEELNQRANRMAHFLQQAGVGPEKFVGIYLHRSTDMMVALFGVLKAGGAYIPLDLSYPKERLGLILTESQMMVLLTEEELLEQLPLPLQNSEIIVQNGKGASYSNLEERSSSSWPRVVCLDAMSDELGRQSADNLFPETTPDNLAYVIYTSGSTGVPKGVMVPHRGLVNYLTWSAKTYDVQSGRGALVHSSIAFDMAVTSLFTPLLVGKTVNFLPEKAGIDTLSHTLVDQPGWSFLKVTPSHLEMLAYQMPRRDRCVNRLLVGGETLRGHTVNNWRTQDQDVTVINEYGPTEAVVGCCVYEVPKYEVCPEAQPIGRPISNVQLYILNRYQQPVPIGVSGELYIGGQGVARGYLKQPELTEQVFIPNPFSGDPNARLYKTGDCCRYRADGTIEFLGRVDRMVKLRGFRVELGEIESLLSKHSAVQEAVVVLNDQLEDPTLTAYIVPALESEEQFNDSKGKVSSTMVNIAPELHAFLQEWVPSYMLPSTFSFIDEIPLTSNGKIDYKALEKIAPTHVPIKDSFVSPGDMLEVQLVHLWEAALGVKPISVQDNFFDLGGHSLLAVRLWVRMESVLGKTLPLSLLYRAPTIAKLAKIIRQQGGATQWEYLGAVQPAGSQPPLYFVPGAGGTGLYLRDLAKHLGQDQPLYAFLAQGLDGKKPFHSSVEEMARNYVADMRRLQPEGPYFLAGHSFGGLVAAEMGQQLQQAGHSVALLAILDTPGPAYLGPSTKPRPTTRKREPFIVRFPRHVGNLMSSSLHGQYDYMGTRLGNMGRHWRKRIFKKLTPYICYGLHALGVPVPLTLRSDYMRFVISVEVGMAYEVRPYTGPLTIFQTEQTSNNQEGLGWNDVAWGGLKVNHVAGNHGDLVNDPYADTLAETLNNCLQKAREESKAEH